MSELVVYLLVFLGGIGLGLQHFGGLWLTVRNLASLKRPYLIMAFSFIIRSAVSVAGFYLLMWGDWVRLLVAMSGFLIARMGAVYRFGPEVKPTEALAKLRETNE